jgi:hypothetical protein
VCRFTFDVLEGLVIGLIKLVLKIMIQLQMQKFLANVLVVQALLVKEN